MALLDIIIHKKLGRKLAIILLIALCLFSQGSYLYADNNPPAPKEGVDHEYREYAKFLNRLDIARPNSILTAKGELFSRFKSKTDESKNEAFRAFWKFYNQVVEYSNMKFSSNESYQHILSEIAKATGLYDGPFPAFDKLNNKAAREIKNNYESFLDELCEYRTVGMNFGSSEGTWYLKGDLDFILEASSITTGGYKDYVGFYVAEWKKDVVEDGGLLISWDDLRKRIVRWEQFAVQHPQLPEIEKVVKLDLSWMINVYLAGIDNSPVYGSGGRLDSKLQRSYEVFLKEGTASAYYNVIRDVYAIWNKNEFKVSKELVVYLQAKGYEKFVYVLERALK